MRAPLPDELTIRVSRWDIERGRVGDNDRCPVALAARRLVQQDWPGGDVCVTSRMLLAWPWYTQVGVLYALPEHVQQWCRAFDDGRASQCEPFEFTCRRSR